MAEEWKEEQVSLFGDLPTITDMEWQDMPDFNNETKEAYHKLIIRFRNEEDLQEFAKLLNQKLNNKTESIWHPKLQFANHYNTRYVDENEQS